MKKLILITVIAVLYANSVLGQDHLLQSKVSALVVSHFLNDYPTATDEEWEVTIDANGKVKKK